MNVLDFEKIIYNFDRVKELFTIGRTFPLHAAISLSNRCNHRCIWCTAYEFQEEKAISLDSGIFINRMREAADRGLKAVTYIGNGEPTSYRGFESLIHEVGAMGLEQGMFTNGFLLDRYMSSILERFLWVRVSLDAGCPEIHELTHGVKGQFDQIIENINNLVSGRKGQYPTIGVQYAVHQENMEDLYQSARIVREAGADYFSIKPIFNRGAVGKKAEKNRLKYTQVHQRVESVRELENDKFKVFFRPHQMKLVETNRLEHKFKRCVAGHFSVSIWEDGQVSVCGPFKVMVGNINENSLVDICRSDETQQAINNLDLSYCKNGCRYLEFNSIIERLRNSDRDLHVNFI